MSHGQLPHEDGYMFSINPTPQMFDHGFDEELRDTVFGYVQEMTADEKGIWVKAQLDRRARYMDMVEELLAAGELGQSIGPDPRFVKTTGNYFTHFPVTELSLTPTPKNPLTSADVVQSLNPLLQRWIERNKELPGQSAATAADEPASVSSKPRDIAIAQMKLHEVTR